MLQISDFRHTRIYQEGYEEGFVEGLVLGREEAREKSVEEIAKTLLEKGMPVTEIAELTGLTLTQVRKLAKKPRKR